MKRMNVILLEQMKESPSCSTVSCATGIIGVTIWYLQILERTSVLNLSIHCFYHPTYFYSLCYVNF